MPAEHVLDASVLAAALFSEPKAALARAAMLEGALQAPDFLLLEIASVAGKKLKRGELDQAAAEQAPDLTREIVNDLTPFTELLPQAFALAQRGRISLYDALYLALAQVRCCAVLTLDERLVTAATAAGLADKVRRLG